MARISNLLKRAGAQCLKLVRLRAVRVIGLILLLLLPTFLALIHAYISDNTITVVNSDKIAVELYTEEGKLIAKEESSSEYITSGSLVEMIHTIHQTKAKTSKSAKDLEEEKALIATLTQKSGTARLSCYFSLATGNSYCVDESGQVYKIAQDVCDRFFSSRYAESLYSHSVFPALTTGDGERVLPSSLTWKYKNWNGTYVESLLNEATAELLSYSIPGAISLQFATKPDNCAVEAYGSNRELIYSGSLEGLEKVIAGSAHVKIHASWNQTEDRAAFGSAHYEFDVQIRDRSAFEVNRISVQKGGYLLLSCTNITDLSRLSFTATSEREDASYVGTPIFHLDGNTARAILSFPIEMTGDYYDFTVSYGASVQSFSIRILPANSTASITLNKESELLSQAISKDAKDEVGRLVKELASSQMDLPYSFSANELPLGENAKIGYTYRDKVLSSDGLASFTAPGVEYLTDSVSDVPVGAVNSGRVIHTGYSDYLGNFIVIEHGLGLRTWYCHLSDFNVRVGDYVLSGQAIGKSGSSAIAAGNGVLLLCSLYDRFLDPALLFEG